MADFFELLRLEQGRDPGKLEQFFSSHPPSADREARIRQQAARERPARSADVGGFDRMRAGLKRLSPASAPVTERRAQARAQDGSFDMRVDAPSGRFQRFEQRNDLFAIEHPDNWRAYASESGYAVSFAPEGGVVDTGDGREAMLYGVIVNHYAPFEGYTERQKGSRRRSYAPFEDTEKWRGSLEDATDDLVRQLVRSNPYLRAEDGEARREQIDGASSFSVVLLGRSPITGEEEKVTVVTRSLSDGHVLYALCIAPSRGHDVVARTFAQMLRTLSVDDSAAHRVTHTRSRAISRTP